MAFRGYELNLMLRVQDRATTRLRRLSSDLGGVNRAAQLQREVGRIANAQQANFNKQAKLAAQLQDHTLTTGQKALSYQSRMNSLKATELSHATKLKRIGLDLNQIQNISFRNGNAYARLLNGQIIGLNQKNAQIALRGLSTQQQMTRLRMNEGEAVARLNAGLATAATEQGFLNTLAAKTTAEYEKEAAMQQRMIRNRSLIHGGSVALMFGGLGLGLSAGLSSTFANFNREVIKTSTQLRGVNEPMSKTIQISRILGKSILDLTRQFPSTAAENAQAAFEIASGIDMAGNSQARYAKTSALLKTANKVAVAGFTDLKTATDAMIVTLNNFDPRLKNVDKVINTLFATVRFGRGDFATFSQLFGPVAAAGKAAGQNLTEVGGALAFLTTRLPQPQAAAGLQRLLQVMGDKRFVAGFKDLFKVGITHKELISGKEVEKLDDLSTIITKIVTRAKELKSGGIELQNLIQTITKRGEFVLTGKDTTGVQGTIQARRALTNLITGYQQYLNIIKEVNLDTNEFNSSFQAGMQSPGVRWQIAVNQFKAFAIILGEYALPQMVRFIEWINKLAHRFEDLSPRTRRLIGIFMVWGSAITVAVGIIAMLVGAIGTLISWISRLAGPLEGTVGLLGRLAIVAKRLSVIGAISIIIKTAIQGDPKAKDFLAGALSGAIAGGTIGGPWGALAGGIIVPVAMKVSSDFKDDSFEKKIQEIIARQRAIKYAIPVGIEAVERNRDNVHNIMQDNEKAKNSIANKWKELASELSGIDVFNTLSQQAAQMVSNIQVTLAKAEATGNTALVNKLTRQSIIDDWQLIYRLEKQADSPGKAKALIQLYNDITQKNDSLASSANSAASSQGKLADERIRAQLEAKRNQMDLIARAADNLANKFKELEQVNKAAFGIFTGPISQGPIAQLYNNINSMLQGFGIKPIAIPITLQLQDMKVQLRNFTQFRRDLNILRRRGAPRELIDELRNKGVEALPLLEGLRKAGPGAFKEYVDLWEKSQKKIQQSTKKDMDDTLALWKSYGNDIAWQIVQGLASDKAQAVLRKGYKNYIVATFGKELAASLQKEVQDAVANWQRTQQNNSNTTNPVKPPPRPPKPPTRSTIGVGAGVGVGAGAGAVVHNHGDNITIHADSADTARAIKKAMNEHSFNRRNRR